MLILLIMVVYGEVEIAIRMGVGNMEIISLQQALRERQSVQIQQLQKA
jgi:hypothetical protein